MACEHGHTPWHLRTDRTILPGAQVAISGTPGECPCCKEVTCIDPWAGKFCRHCGKEMVDITPRFKLEGVK